MGIGEGLSSVYVQHIALSTNFMRRNGANVKEFSGSNRG